MAFVLHRDTRGLSALGATGGAIGYVGITPSVALRVNTYSGRTNYSVGVSTGGVISGGFAGQNIDSQPDRLDLGNGNWFESRLQYSGATKVLRLTMRELCGRETCPVRTFSFNVDIQAALGCTAGVQGCLATVGFTAGCGTFFARFLVGSLTWSELEATATQTPSQTPTNTASISQGISISNTASASFTPTGTRTPPATVTASRTPSATATAWKLNGGAGATGFQPPITLTTNAAYQTGSAVWPGRVWADAFSIRAQIKVDQITGGGADGE